MEFPFLQKDNSEEKEELILVKLPFKISDLSKIDIETTCNVMI